MERNRRLSGRLNSTEVPTPDIYLKSPTMKTNTLLHIPFREGLDGMSLDAVGNALEEGGARFSVESLNWPETFPYRPLTVVTAAHTSEAIYIDFLVRCNYLRAANYTDNSPVSEDSCVEFYLQPNPSSPHYFTFEFNCIGILNSAECVAQADCRPLSADELQTIGRYASVGRRPFEEVEGSFIWSVVVAIPLRLLGIRYEGKPIAMRGNFNKCASATSQPHFLSWAPIVTPEPDFHQPDFFGDIILD